MADKDKLIDELDELIYLSDPQTYELVYVNKAGRARMHLDETSYQGQMCYKIFQGSNSPCSFCNNAKLNTKDFLRWEYTNPHLGRHFLLKDKFINWNGKKIRMEMAVDITEKENISQQLSEKLDISRAVIDCISSLTSAKNLQDAINMLLQTTGSFYQADRAYIFELNAKSQLCTNTNEWCKEGVSSQLNTLQEVSIPQRWLNEFSLNKSVVIENLEFLKESSPEEYSILNRQNITTLYATPLFMDQLPVYYIGVDNPSAHLDNAVMMETLAYFIITEITKRKLQEKLIFMGYHDSLTGLMTRNSYIEYCYQVSQKDLASMGVVVADINGLKRINQNYGHRIGDDMVKQTSNLLRTHFADDQIFRLSGDEFVIICENISRESFLPKVKAAQEALTSNANYGVTMGYTWADVDIDIKLLVNHADELMFVEKQRYYKNAASTSKHHSPELLKQLLDSITNCEFEMYLQPKTSIATGELIGAEALVRYNHPEHGLIFPDQFIPLLEHDNTIKYIDFFIYEEVCKTLAKWQEAGFSLIPISLNFSRLTMLETDLIDTLLSIHRQYQVPRNLIEIEITETIGEIERETIADIGKNIKEQGFRISLDDFGAKYTSMSILTIMNFDALKLDRSLISNLEENPNNQIIVKYVIEMCREMNVKSLAEGVENEHQLALLKSLSCDIAQGFLFSKPIPLSEFERKYHFVS